MQIVIDISDDLKDKICNATEEWAARYVEGWNLEIARIIRNGTPLPKGHGRLIDGDALYKLFEQDNFIWEADSYIHTAPIIIEADEGEEE